MKLNFSLWVLAGGIPLLAVHAQPQWAQGDPSAEEQEALEWLNAARADPLTTLDSLLSLNGADAVISGFMLAEQPTTAAQLTAQLAAAMQTAQSRAVQFPSSSAISQAPLVFYPLFQNQARTLGSTAVAPGTTFPALRPPPAYIYPTPFFGNALLNGPGNAFAGANATGALAQFGPYGGTYSEVSEANLYSSSITGREWVLSLLTGAGTGSPAPSFLVQGDPLPGLTLGHTRMAGLAITAASLGNRILTLYTGSSEFFTQSDLPYGNTGTVFITGVAYQDQGGDGRYHAGEGLPGAKITLDREGWCAVTASAGGYAIPVPANSGAYRLTLTGGPLDGATASAVVGADSVKVDWVLPAAAPVLPVQVPVPASDGSPQLVGLSTRGLIQSGQNALIGGFVIGGGPGTRKKVLIRGVGPSLQTVGFPGAECIPATRLQVFDSSGSLIGGNSGWTTALDGGAAVSQAALSVGDFALTNWAGGGGDSALVITLAPGAYTAVVSPAPNLPAVDQSGRVGLVEIYDVSRVDGARFVNISSRALAGTGDQQLVAGCTVAGSGHERLLLRGVGPGLGSFGLNGLLPNPQVTLYDGASRVLAANDDWSNSAQTLQIQDLASAVGAFALSEGGVDASLLFLAAPGNYSAIVSAKSGTLQSGAALVELYEAP